MYEKTTMQENRLFLNVPRMLARSLLILWIATAGTATGFGQQNETSAGLEDRLLENNTREKIIDELTNRLSKEYVFPDVAKKMVARIRKQQRKGVYKKITDLKAFTDQLTRDLHSIKRDLHMAIIPHSQYASRSGATGDEISEEDFAKNYLERMAYHNFGFYKAERLQGNIGYLNIHELAYDEIDGRNAGGETAYACMAFLSHSNALIIDLRECYGGRTEMIQLLFSYFFDEPIHFSTKIDRVTDDATKIMSHENLFCKKMVNEPIYVLIGRHTVSGGEQFAFSLKNQGRATLIGEKTMGAAHRTHIKSIPKLGVVFFIPHGTDIDPITGTDWEGIGVEPDIAVASEDALEMAHMKALEACLDNEYPENQAYEMAWVFRGLRDKQDRITLDEETLREYVGTYNKRKVTLENGKLYYQREGQRKRRIHPLGEDWFKFEDKQLFYFRLNFSRDGAGRIKNIHARYDTGEPDRGIN